MIYLLDDDPRDRSNLDLVSLTPALSQKIRADLGKTKSGAKILGLGSFPLSLLIAVVNGFLESRKLPIRLITVGDGA